MMTSQGMHKLGWRDLDELDLDKQYSPMMGGLNGCGRWVNP